MEGERHVDAHRVGEGEPRSNGDLGGAGGEAKAGSSSPSRPADYHGVELQSPERPGGRLGEAPGMSGGGGAPDLPTPIGTHQQPYRPASSANSTPRRAGGGLLHEGSPLRAAPRSPHAAGLQTFGSKYMPFAAGFSGMYGEAPVYRSSRLHAINPTAAASEDVSYFYTLDSGAETPATRAADPSQRAEHVRNTAAATQQGGFMGKVFAPIR